MGIEAEEVKVMGVDYTFTKYSQEGRQCQSNG
jgi:hypothetical protein